MGLREQGTFVGAFRPNIDVDVTINNFLLHSDGISWITINFMGTTAEVQVVEYRPKDVPGQQDDVPSIIVAARDGVIERYELTGGIATVNLGSPVTAGQMLVSGMMTDPDGNLSYIGSARGRVFARTWREFEVFVPFNTDIRYEDKQQLRKRTYNIFGREINLSPRGRNFDSECDIIERRTRLTLFSFIELPIWIVEEVVIVYAYTPTVLTEEQARDTAVALAADRLSTEWQGAQIIELAREEIISDEGITLRYSVTAIEDIAEWRALEIFEDDMGENISNDS
jgi:similar to stage IV sporulation protein